VASARPKVGLGASPGRLGITPVTEDGENHDADWVETEPLHPNAPSPNVLPIASFLPWPSRIAGAMIDLGFDDMDRLQLLAAGVLSTLVAAGVALERSDTTPLERGQQISTVVTTQFS